MAESEREAEAAEVPEDMPVPMVTQAAAAGPEMLAHVSNHGDLRVVLGEWAGLPGGGQRLEAIMLPAPAEGAPPEMAPAIDCQALFGPSVRGEWIPPGKLCGTKGFGLGLSGLRFRLSPAAAPFFVARYDLSFTDGTQKLDIPGMAPVLAPTGAAVEAIRLRLLRRRPAQPVIMLGQSTEGLDRPWVDFPVKEDKVGLRIVSPAFEALPPALRHGEIIPTGSRAAMDVSWKRGLFPESPVVLRAVENAIVVDEGLVFDSDLHLVSGTGRLFTPAQIAAAQAAARAALENGSLGRIGGYSVLCKSRAPNNFGHFLVEMLPRAWLARRLVQGFGLAYLVHHSALQPIILEAMQCLGIPATQVHARDNAPVRCDVLLMIDGLSNHGIYQSPFCAEALGEIAAGVPAGPYERIFIRRRATVRPLVNEPAVEEALRERGFVGVETGQMSLREQISLFKGAKIVVGPLGAALTNIAFCAPGTRIVALTAASFPDTFFWFLSRHRRLNYLEIRGEDQPGGDAAEPWNAGFSMAEEDLDFLRQL